MEYSNENCPDKESIIYYTIITIFGCTLNIMLFFLIKYHTHDLMKPYKRILYTSTLIDFWSAFFQFATQTRPSLVGTNKILTFSFDGFLPKLLDNFSLFKDGNLNYAFIPEYFFCYTIVMFTWFPFLYRYLLTCWNYQMSNFVYSILMGFIFISSLIASILIVHLSVVSHDVNTKLIPEPDPNCFRYLVQFSAHINKSTGNNSLIFFLWYSCYCTFLQWSGLIIVFCAWRIFVFFRQKSHLMQNSAKNKSVQFQINLVIFLQAIFPLCVCYLPHEIVNFASRFKIFEELLWNAYYKSLYSSYSILPVLNPLSAILSVQSYRRAIIDFLLCPFKSFRLMSEESFAKWAQKWNRSSASVSNVPASQVL